MKKVFLLLPDGVGLRNFIYTDFLEQKGDIELVVWSSLPSLNLENVEVKYLPKFVINTFTELKKHALTRAELIFNAKKFSNKAYLDYIKPSHNRRIKTRIKDLIRDTYTFFAKKSSASIMKLRESYFNDIKKTTYYYECLEVLKNDRPDFIFCTHQRTSVAVAPILAAKKLGIKTGTFIFSWDNVPKGNLAVEADFYFVWSEYMANELLKYYPWIKEKQIKIVGTPQFLPYKDSSLIKSKVEFFKENNLDILAKTICFSGDDVTTSPFDQKYLNDIAETVENMNETSSTKYQIIFRKCPADFSDRYGEVLNKYKGLICVLDPVWSSPNDESSWDSVVPLSEDSILLANTVKHSDVVINVGSTMAIDFSLNKKTACYLNYNVDHNEKWNIHKIYKYIHFETMGDLDPVYWINSKKDIKNKIISSLEDNENKLENAQKWAEKIALHPIETVNERYWKEIRLIMKQQ